MTGLASGVVWVSANDRHTCAVLSTGAAKCWGVNDSGQLGDNTMDSHAAPTDVVGLSGAATISVGHSHTCARLTSGGAKCRGFNGNFGQVGDGTTVDPHLPTDVTGLANGVAEIVAGGQHSCARLTSGGVKCWGDNQFGQLGDGTNTMRKVPTDVVGLSSGVAAISAVEHYTCAQLTSGGVKCWGKNISGAVGDGTQANRNVPTDVTGLSGVVAIGAGRGHTCAALTGGGASCWGINAAGQLGDGTLTGSNVPSGVVGL